MNQLPSAIFSLHYIGLNLKKGVTEEKFESFVQNHGVNIPAYPGWRWTLLKGLRGERQNQYLMLYEADSMESYTRFINNQGEKTKDAYAFWCEHPMGVKLINTWKTFATFGELPVIFSTYRQLAENEHSSLAEGPNFQMQNGKKTIKRVVGLHNLALHSGVCPRTFDDFILNNVHRIDDYPGWKFHMLKGIGGNRVEQYLVMLEIESLESLYSFHPELDISTEKSLQFVKEHQESERMYEEWRKLASFSGSPQLYTDYITIAGSL